MITGRKTELGLIKSARACGSAMSIIRATRSTPRRISGRNLRQLRPASTSQAEVNSRAYVGAFGFEGPSRQEDRPNFRRRAEPCAIAKNSEEQRDLLLLDEPTNNLERGPCCALGGAARFRRLRRHLRPRWFFLDTIATHMLAFEGEGHVKWFRGQFRRLSRGKEAPPSARQRNPRPLKWSCEYG